MIIFHTMIIPLGILETDFLRLLLQYIVLLVIELNTLLPIHVIAFYNGIYISMYIILYVYV